MNQLSVEGIHSSFVDGLMHDGDILQRLDPNTVKTIRQIVGRQIESTIRMQPSYQALWIVLGNHNRHDAARTRCETLLACIASDLVHSTKTIDLELVCRVVMSALKHETLDLISASARSTDAPSIAFFLPTRAFSGHFGSLPGALRDRGFHVMQIFGTYHDLDQFKSLDSFMVVDDMITLVKDVDGFITAQILDCLPQDSKKILIDHLSFVNFNLGSAPGKSGVSIKEVDSTDRLDGDALVEKYTAFPVFFPMFDIHVTASHVLTDNIDRIAKT